jgi:hypothetical protein
MKKSIYCPDLAGQEARPQGARIGRCDYHYQRARVERVVLVAAVESKGLSVTHPARVTGYPSIIR